MCVFMYVCLYYVFMYVCVRTYVLMYAYRLDWTFPSLILPHLSKNLAD
jgi:hypothetical protein